MVPNERYHQQVDCNKMIRPYRMKWEGHAACMEEIRNTYKILFGKPEEKKPLGKPRLRQEDNIKINLK
jgi:hypothetical protein